MDGNNLRCHGAMSLIIKIVEECENEVIRKELEEKARLEEEEKRLAEGLRFYFIFSNYYFSFC